jgi:uncharacterized protein
MSSKLHPDGKLNPSDSVTNTSGNDSILDLIEARQISRRNFLRGSLGAAAMVAVGGGVAAAAMSSPASAKPVARAIAAAYLKSPSPAGAIGFASVAPNLYLYPADDAVIVPPGYSARVLVAWGDSLSKEANWDPASAMDEETQLHCYGSHTDGMHYFPFPQAKSQQANSRGLLVTNSEYCDPPLVNNVKPAANYATVTMTLDMVRAQQAAHGVNVVEVQEKNGTWSVRRGSAFNRRITGNTPCRISGPAAGHELMKTAADPGGKRVLGTLNNCAHGYTPWGTYLTCEENWNGYFSNETGDVEGELDLDRKFNIITGQTRYGVIKGGFGYRWHEVDERFRADLHPNEPNRFGWVVEIDPRNPQSTPIKRTAMGRFKHESAQLVVDRSNRVAFYMGDDERNEYVYKFVCAKPLNPAGKSTDRDMLDKGTLYVARFNADGSGKWLPLVWGQNGLTPANGFADQAELLVKTRQAADRLGATMMDRPEWTAAHPETGEVYLTLTNNNRRGSTPASSNSVDGTTNAGSARPPVDAANPRPDNDYGHIIRWREKHAAVTATEFEWDIFAQCGDKAVDPTVKKLGASYNPAGHDGYLGNINGDDYGAPDGLWFDKDGRLWIQTDQVGNATGDFANIGGNTMSCADPATGETRRFLTAPKNCEVTGVISTPDGKAMFVGIQHPGEDWTDNYTDNSTWPDSGRNGPTAFSNEPVAKPRSGVVVITKDDGGVIGT